MKKFKYFKPILAVCVLAVCLVGVTLALQTTAVQDIINSFTAASNSTEIEEPDDPSAAKEVKITNKGENPTYVRARVTVEGTSGTLPEDVTVTIVDAPKDTVGDKEICVVMDPRGMWDPGADEFYYYRDIVPVGGETTLLVEKVLVGAEVPKTLEFDVVVTEESVLAVEDEWSKQGMDNAFDRLDK